MADILRNLDDGSLPEFIDARGTLGSSVSPSPVDAARTLRREFERLEAQVRAQPAGASRTTHVRLVDRARLPDARPDKTTTQTGAAETPQNRDAEVRAIVATAQAQIAALRVQLETTQRPPRRVGMGPLAAVALAGATLSAGLVVWALQGAGGQTLPAVSGRPPVTTPAAPLVVDAGAHGIAVTPGDTNPPTPVVPPPRLWTRAATDTPPASQDAADATTPPSAPLPVETTSPQAVAASPLSSAATAAQGGGLPAPAADAPGVATATPATTPARPPTAPSAPDIDLATRGNRPTETSQDTSGEREKPEPGSPRDPDRPELVPGPATRSALLLSRRPPIYPEAARLASNKGAVDVDVTIDTMGRVTRATAVTGPVLLRSAAERAARQWRYQPALHEGVAIESQRRVRITFE